MTTTHLVGGPLIRYGGKGRIARLLVPHFARARLYVEPYFGAGSVFYKVPAGTYEREAVNDLDKSIVTFFRVLRDRTEELLRVCSLTPYARDEFAAALEHSEDELEEARRVWVRSRQGFAGKARTVGDWGRKTGVTTGEGQPKQCEAKRDALTAYAARLLNVAVDSIEAAEFVTKWTPIKCPDAMVYCDPPYVPEARSGADYTHEMNAEDHRALASALSAAVQRGARVAISGYPSALYDELYQAPAWRRMELDVAFYGSRSTNATDRRTECLWMSYPVHDELGYVAQGDLFVPRTLDHD